MDNLPRELARYDAELRRSAVDDETVARIMGEARRGMRIVRFVIPLRPARHPVPASHPAQ
jgi:hypothetical protein